jgi:hypothetical protein
VTAVASELDILRSAKLVLDHHGPDALIRNGVEIS